MIQFNGYLASALTCNSLEGNSDMCVFSWMTLVKHLLQMDALPVMLYMPLLLLLSIMLWLVTSLLNACCLLGLHTLCIENLYSMQLISSLFDRGKIFILNEKCWCIFVWHLDQPLCMCAPHGTSTGILFFFLFFLCVWGKFPLLRVYSQSKIMYNYLFAWRFLFWNARAISSHPKLYADIIRALTFEVKLDCQNDVGKPVSREASGLCRIFVLGMWVWKW